MLRPPDLLVLRPWVLCVCAFWSYFAVHNPHRSSLRNFASRLSPSHVFYQSCPRPRRLARCCKARSPLSSMPTALCSILIYQTILDTHPLAKSSVSLTTICNQLIKLPNSIQVQLFILSKLLPITCFISLFFLVIFSLLLIGVYSCFFFFSVCFGLI